MAREHLPFAQREMAERCAWSLVWLGVLVGGTSLWGSWWSWPAIDVLAPVLVACSLAGLAVCWWSASPRSLYHQALAMAAVLVAAGAPQIVLIHTRRYYSTDSAAFDHVAARLLVNGSDPYMSSLSAASRLLNVPARFWTYTINGGHIAHVSYPAGSFLVDAPAFALGFRHQVVDWMDLYAWLATGILLFVLLPRAVRWLAPLIVLTAVYLNAFSSGGTDVMFLPFLMLALWRWDRYGMGREAGIARWIGPVALGLACSIKQTPWFCLLFLAVGIAIETRRRGRSPAPVVARYVVVAVAVFAAVNLPFVIWNPVSWWRGTLTPFVKPLVADGQGVVSLAIHGVSGGVDLTLLTLGSGLAYLAILASFVAWYPQMKRMWLFLLPVAFFFAPRSFSSYLVDLLPVAVVGAVTVGTAIRTSSVARLGRFGIDRLLVGALVLATCVTTAVAFVSVPLGLAVRNLSVSRSGLVLKSVTVSVTNQTGSTLAPHFMVNVGDPHPSGFWLPTGRAPVVVGPGRSVTVTLYPPVPTYFPPSSSDWVVEAYTSSPNALSTSKLIWRHYVPKESNR
jgi:uncharacterized membrane protein